MATRSSKNDPRFVLHRQQPRAEFLTPALRRIALADPAFAVALRARVSNPDRWAAFIAGERYFLGKPCATCSSTRRRPRDGCCLDCVYRRNAGDWALMRRGVMPPAQRSRDGHAAHRAAMKAPAAVYERNGWGFKHAAGIDYYRDARHPANGWIRCDLLSPAQLFHLIETQPDLQHCARVAGWSV
ncbi:hypothetical protein D9M69_300610 [compost metagenome]